MGREAMIRADMESVGIYSPIFDAMITLTVNAYWYSGELYSGEAV